MVVGRSTLLRHVSQNLCLARHGFWTIPKTDSGTAFQHGQWWDAFGCAARTSSSSGGELINVAGAQVRPRSFLYFGMPCAGVVPEAWFALGLRAQTRALRAAQPKAITRYRSQQGPQTLAGLVQSAL
ncbi:hypothetical protein LMG26411_01025 [Cupriavidus numazuensis]|uniref:Transposase n=2 Tax=Cupriavidus numazuensis TaxID=221992 RepID=A0ABM8TCZ6_9BURK|nr:hypothetical protein LMG26411_01025 [Cupriavidus numazuensis]